MAKVTITIEDNPQGLLSVQPRFDPPLNTDLPVEEQPTAHLFAASVMDFVSSQLTVPAGEAH